MPPPATTRRRSRLLRSLAALWLCAAVAPLASAQRGGCDESVRTPARDPLRYELRDDRCEGIFEEEYSAALDVVWFGAQRLADLGYRDRDSLQLSWTPPAPAARVRLHARGIRHDVTNYRMDYPPPGVQPDGTSFEWSLDILRRLGVPELAPDDIGLVGWTELEPIRGPVLLPLRASATETQADRYWLELRPGSSLSDIWMSLAPANPDGTPGEFIRFQEPLDGSAFPAGVVVPVVIPFSDLPETGVYYLAFHSRPGARVEEPSLVRWFYHDAP